MTASRDETVPSPRPSEDLVKGVRGAGARAFLRAVGFTDDDFGKPQVAIADTANDVTPGNMHLQLLSGLAREGVRTAGAVPLSFSTIAVSDGIGQGHEGMRASLASREVVCDSIELMALAQLADLRPSGRFLLSDLDRAGGVPDLMAQMLEAGLIDGSARTVTGLPWPRISGANRRLRPMAR